MILEKVVFKFHRSLNTNAILGLLAEADNVLSSYTGFICRQVAYTEVTDSWTELLWWTDRDCAVAAAAQFVRGPCAKRFIDSIDGGTRLTHSVVIHQFPKYEPNHQNSTCNLRREE